MSTNMVDIYSVTLHEKDLKVKCLRLCKPDHSINLKIDKSFVWISKLVCLEINLQKNAVPVLLVTSWTNFVCQIFREGCAGLPNFL